MTACLRLTLLYGSDAVPSNVAIAVYLGGGVPALQRFITCFYMEK